jgi:hypothetical protein
MVCCKYVAVDMDFTCSFRLEYNTGQDPNATGRKSKESNIRGLKYFIVFFSQK